MVVGVWESSVSLPVSEISAPGDVQQTSQHPQHLHGYLYCSLRMGGYNSVYFHFVISLSCETNKHRGIHLYEDGDD